MALCDNVKPGFMGKVTIGGTTALAESISIAPNQDIVTPELIVGSWDLCAWYYGPLVLQGSVAGVLNQDMFNTLIAFAGNRKGVCGDLAEETIQVQYYCSNDATREFEGMANQVSFSVAAGDVAKFSLDIIGTGAGSQAANIGGINCATTALSELTTWRDAKVVVTGLGEVCVSNFELTIANGVEPVYCLGGPDGGSYSPDCLVPGRRTITGSLTVYGAKFAGGSLNEANGTVKFMDQTFTVRFAPLQPSGSTGVVTSTVAFTAIGPQSSLNVV